jgi:hypothetical protein
LLDLETDPDFATGAIDGPIWLRLKPGIPIPAVTASEDESINHQLNMNFEGRSEAHVQSFARGTVKQQLLANQIVTRLLDNRSWEPAARAAIDYFVDGKTCRVSSWSRSSTWKQVQMVFEDISKKR